jgi:hypothetical protein
MSWDCLKSPISSSQSVGLGLADVGGCKLRFHQLTGRAQGIVSRTERHASVDGGAPPGLGCDGKRSVHQLYPFFHAGEAKPSAPLCRFAVKARAGVLYREMKRSLLCPQSHSEMADSAVFC